LYELADDGLDDHNHDNICDDPRAIHGVSAVDLFHRR
jgi:hypothetical protein